MSIFVIKIIACVTMLLDHIKYAIPETRCFATQYLGRIAFPLFAFMIGEGYAHTKDLQKYCKRLLIAGIISQIPFMYFRSLVGEWRMLNVMFTLLLGIAAITIFDKFEKKYYISLPAVLLFALIGQIIKVDYGAYGVLMVFVLYLARNHKILRIFALVILNLIYYFNIVIVSFSMQSLISYMFTTLPAILLVFYNGKLGRKMKYIFYMFYPVHMIILYILTFM